MIKITINPNKKIAEEAREAVKNNDGSCPCALFKEEDTKCICKDFRDKIESNYEGECNCGLYVITRR